MQDLSCSALALHRRDFRDMVMSILRSSVAISPAKKSFSAIVTHLLIFVSLLVVLYNMFVLMCYLTIIPLLFLTCG